jgi:hypothetical protein
LRREIERLAVAGKARIYEPKTPPLDVMIREAWVVGQGIDVSDVGYGPAHWGDGKQFHDAAIPYYSFLAGLIRTQACARILEVGTHHGGSIQSMIRGMADPASARVVTIDITDINSSLHAIPCLTKLTGDANSEAVIHQVLAIFQGEPIDLLYIDANHSFMPTITNLGLYATLLRPRLVVMDDIVLNPEMKVLWQVLRAAFGAEAVDCVDVVPEIRSPACGFGLMRLR